MLHASSLILKSLYPSLIPLEHLPICPKSWLWWASRSDAVAIPCQPTLSPPISEASVVIKHVILGLFYGRDSWLAMGVSQIAQVRSKDSLQEASGQFSLSWLLSTLLWCKSPPINLQGKISRGKGDPQRQNRSEREKPPPSLWYSE